MKNIKEFIIENSRVNIITKNELELLTNWCNENYEGKVKDIKSHLLGETAFVAIIGGKSGDCKIVVGRPENYKGGLKIMIYDRYEENKFRLPFEWPNVKKQTQNGVRVNETIKQIIEKLDELKPKINAALDKGEAILK